MSNAIVRSKGDKITYFGHEFDTCKDYSTLHFRLPFERVGHSVLYVSKACLTVIKGYLVDWDAQKAIWDGIFSDQIPNVNTHALLHPFLSRSLAGQIDTAETSLLITEPYFNLPNIQEVYDQFVFEEYEFQSYFCSTRMSVHLPFS